MSFGEREKKEEKERTSKTCIREAKMFESESRLRLTSARRSTSAVPNFYQGICSRFESFHALKTIGQGNLVQQHNKEMCVQHSAALRHGCISESDLADVAFVGLPVTT
ncbi:hypothetical protein CPC08DRAFT_713848 [Agrocybe pediades]|nr:hypothetical protein CPC08DRAFT_713848 [Agrocybe pediades]